MQTRTKVDENKKKNMGIAEAQRHKSFEEVKYLGSIITNDC